MALQKITAPPTVPEIIKFLGDVVDEFDTKLGADETAVDSNKLGGAEASAYAKLASPVFTGTPEVPTAPPGTKTDQAASTNFVQEEINSRLNGVVPVGTIIAYAANQNPEGYILCNGANVSRTTYADLFAVIGTTYGAGDGSTTFTLPNLIDRFIEGSSTAGNYHNAGLPNITGGSNIFTHGNGCFKDCGSSGALSNTDRTSTSVWTACREGGSQPQGVTVTLDASRSSSI
ncbi:MAG: tail fiber protein, partial [Phascolarctobacterium sp.]|nr:tail fiber protein [Phascolarctobacterium sp.]